MEYLCQIVLDTLLDYPPSCLHVSLIVLLLIGISLLGFCPGVIVSCLGVVWYLTLFYCGFVRLLFWSIVSNWFGYSIFLDYPPSCLHVSLNILLHIGVTLLGFCPGVILSCLGDSVSLTCTYENLKFSMSACEALH